LPKVLILTPVKNAAKYIDSYFQRLVKLTFDHSHLSVALLESDSTDGTYERLLEKVDIFRPQFRSLSLFKYDYKVVQPPAMERWDSAWQLARRGILARSRNQLLMRALDDEDWVLWLDVDVIEYPDDLLQRLLEPGLDVVHPECVREYGGPSYDLNAWKSNGKLRMQDLRGTGKPVRIDSVGGTALLVRADLHRDGLVFPCFRYGVESPAIRHPHPLWGKGEIETEGFAAMARDMGIQCWGLPDLEILHA
jgi:glycosyltransferase involved in cell wall biosynthesis